MKEHQNVEWKESWRDEYLKWICGFANADGGKLVIGRNDDGKVVGARDAAKLLEDIPNKVRDILGIIVKVNLRGRGGRDLLEIVVEPYSSLYDGKHLKRAALLLFHPDPERFFTGAFVKIGRFQTDSNVLYHDEVHGDLFTQVERVMDLLLTKYLIAWISYRGIHRVETFPIPEEALREAVVNAIVHRDYAIGTPIQIRVYDDKLIIWNAGTLPHDWTVSKFAGSHESCPYSPDIANAFFRAGHIEAWGQGISKIMDACQASGTPRPEMRWEAGGLWVEFAFARAATRQVPDKHHTSTRQVTEVDATVLRAAAAPVTREFLQAAAGLSNRGHFVGAVLKPLLAVGLLEMTIPKKPRSNRQRYRITARGRLALESGGNY